MMRAKKRSLLAPAAVLSAVALGITGCGPDTTQAPAGAESGGKTELSAPTDYAGIEPAKEISFWSNHPSGSIDLEKEMIAKFEEESGIKVNLVTAGANYDEVAQKFQTAQVSGDAGDLVVLSDTTWFPAYLNGSIIPVDGVFEAASLPLDGYYPSFLEDYLYEGEHYAIPYARSTIIFFYNKDAYKAAGLDDSAPVTWQEVADRSTTLAANNPNVAAFGYPSDAYFPSWTMSNLVWSYGGDWSDGWDFSTMTDPETLNAIQFAQNSINDGWAEVLSGDPTTDFAAGAVNQVLASTGGLRGILEASSFEVGAAVLPSGPADTDKVVPTGGAGLGISAHSEPSKQLAAAMLASYLTNSENTAFFSAGTGYLPVQQDADMSTVYEETPLFKVAVDSLPMTRSQNYARVLVPGGSLALDRALMEVLVSGSDVEDALETAKSEIQTTYDRDIAGSVH